LKKIAQGGSYLHVHARKVVGSLRSVVGADNRKKVKSSNTSGKETLKELKNLEGFFLICSGGRLFKKKPGG